MNPKPRFKANQVFRVHHVDHELGARHGDSLLILDVDESGPTYSYSVEIAGHRHRIGEARLAVLLGEDADGDLRT